MNESAHTFRGAWKQRIRALKNVPSLLAIVWHSGPSVVSAATLGRVVGALVPLSMLTVSKRILDSVQAHYTGAPLPASFWYLVGAEAALAVFGSLVGRATSYFDGLLADRFTRYVSVRVMQHASRLDLASYEDPAFYDKLERARVQGSDRIAMVQSLGTVVQQAIVAVSLAAGIVWFSPWLLVLWWWRWCRRSWVKVTSRSKAIRSTSGRRLCGANLTTYVRWAQARNPRRN